MNSLTYKEISKILDLVENELFKLDDKKRRERNISPTPSIIRDNVQEELTDWDMSDKRYEADLVILTAIKDKITQLFERINFTFGVDNNRFNNPPKQEASQ